LHKIGKQAETLLRSRLLSGFSEPFQLDIVDAVAHEIARHLAWPPQTFLVATDFAYQPRSPETTLLYLVVAEQLETFLARQQERDRPVPLFVEREFRSFLDCGVLARGFLRLRCQSCGHDRLLAFSCKRRVWCPSCGGRRMADIAAHLVDRVFPIVPVRQWVLSLPFVLRYQPHGVVGFDDRGYL